MTDMTLGAFTSAPPRIFNDHVIGALLRWRRAGVASALCTLVEVDGSSPRRVGSQMAVSAHGESVGYISSGCAEGAILAEAQSAIAEGAPRRVRYGKGSPFLDIVLPCGSGIEIHIDPAVATADLQAIETARVERRDVALDIDLTLARASRLAAPAAAPDDRHYLRAYAAPLRLVVAGRGVLVDFVARHANDLEWDVVAASPDMATLRRLEGVARTRAHLKGPQDFDADWLDAKTALALLFHDHDWEPAILARAEAAPLFYVGALGSRRTHAERCAHLEAAGAAPDFIQRIRGPIGLDIGGETPPAIALAILSEIVAAAAALRA